MTNIFKNSCATWVKYDKYEIRKANNGTEYVVPTADAYPVIYDPLEDVEGIALDAINTGLLTMSQKSRCEVRAGIMDFIQKYGLLGFMTALPTTSEFTGYEKVYFPKNEFIREEFMDTEKYVELFFPFNRPDFKHSGTSTEYTVGDICSESNDSIRTGALTLAFMDEPLEKRMVVHPDYGERYDWIEQQFKSWAFIFFTSQFYYHDKEDLTEDTAVMMRQSMAAFGHKTPTYRIELRDRPVMVWDFHSLLLSVQMMFGFVISSEDSDVKICKNCNRAFITKNPGAEFCSRECESEY
ncbi:MAG: hypothetical protein Q4F31_07670 [Eubacteriales bacterium]|nr:hypothetical protein [Eubacteriales bacterium]